MRVRRFPKIGGMRYLKRPFGASRVAVQAVEKRFALELPVDLRELWLQSDGPILYFGFKELQFFPMAEVADDIYSLQRYMPGALPLCMDGLGNICIAKLESGSVSSFHVVNSGNLCWADAAWIADTFDEFLDDPVPPSRYLKA